MCAIASSQRALTALAPSLPALLSISLSLSAR